MADVEQMFVPYRSEVYTNAIDADKPEGERRYINIAYDLTNISKIILYCEIYANKGYSNNTTCFGVTSNPPTSYSDIKNGAVSQSKVTSSSLNTTIELDVTDLSGEYYIGVGAASSVKGYITRTIVNGIELVN